MVSEVGSTESSVIEERDEEEDSTPMTKMKKKNLTSATKNRWKRGGIVDPDADDW